MARWWRYRGGQCRPAWRHLGLVALWLLLGSGCSSLCWRRLPPGAYVRGSVQPVSAVRFLSDVTYVDAAGARQSEQRLFDAVFELIGAARSYVVADMFLFNDWTGDASAFRPLSAEFTEALVAKRRACPECTVVLITDPINTAYGGVAAPHLERLRQAGVVVVETDLDRLRDSNAVYSAFWRLLVRPFGNAPGGILPNPFDGGHVTLRTYLRLLNFKANHRKLVIADAGGVPTALVTSANPHDGSSAHSNSGLLFSGPAALDLLGIELAVAAFSGVSVDLALPAVSWPEPALPVTVQVVTERSILEAVLGSLEAARPGDEVDLVMFYLSHRGIIEALQAAWRRGVRVRVVLDPNKDAFGREKGGIPNRQAARDLHRAGVPVRWYDTHGEQCHTKMLLVRSAAGTGELHLGSANYTRRNLENLNLETNLVVRGPVTSAVFTDARDSVEAIWNNTGGRHCTVDYGHYRDHAWLKYWRYRFMEASGLSTF